MRALIPVALALVTSTPAAAQDPQPQEVEVRVVGREDGEPRPGVTVHACLRSASILRLDASGRWVTNTDERLRRLQVSQSARSDPAGRALLTLPDGRRYASEVFAGPPFVGRAERQGDGSLLLAVDQHEPFSVRVVDGSGAPLAGFGVALHAGGKDVSVALTDPRGVALLGVPPGFEARLSVAPAGWIGPREAFPSVATMLRRAQPTLVVPPFGALRIRAVRDGESVRVAVGAANIHDPAPATASRNGGDPDVLGFQFSPVGLGQRLRGTAWIAQRSVRIDAEGPTAAGEVAVFDVDVDPPRPRVSFEVAGEAAELRQPRQLHVTVWTDRRPGTAYARADDDGIFIADFENLLEIGERVVRVEINGSTSALEDTPARIWSAAVPVGRVFGDELLHLGVLRLDGFPPLLRGRVVDEYGKPLARAGVVVRADPASGAREAARTTVYADAQGRFEHLGPVPRDAEGRPVQVVAKAAFEGLESATTAPAPIGGEVVLIVRGAAAERRTPTAGVVEARLVDVRGEVVDQIRVELVAADGTTREVRGAELPADRTARFRGLPAGRYTLRITTPWIGGEPLEVEGLAVPANGVCDDDRLDPLQVGAGLQVAALRVVDTAGVPIAGANAEMRVGIRVFARPTDGTGRVWLAHGHGVAPKVLVTAPGVRPRELDDPRGEVVITMEPAGSMQVRVVGIPAELSRELLQIWVQPDERVGFARAARSPLGDGDVATVPLPAVGRYVVGLHVTVGEPRGGLRSSRIARGAPFAIGEDAPPGPVELRLDDTDVARLREAVKRR